MNNFLAARQQIRLQGNYRPLYAYAYTIKLVGIMFLSKPKLNVKACGLQIIASLSPTMQQDMRGTASVRVVLYSHWIA